MFKQLILTATVTLMVTFSSVEAKTYTISLDQAVKIALKQSPDIVVSRLDFEGARERSKFQEGYYLPQVDLSASANKNGIKYDGQERLEYNSLIGGLSVSQLLYDFGKTSHSVKASKYESDAYRAALYQQTAQKILDTKVNYYEVLKAKSIIDVRQKNIKLQEAQLKRAKRYFESGIKTIIDVSDSQVRLTEATLDLSNANYDLKLRRAILEESLGTTPYSGRYTLKHSKLSLPDISHTLPRITLSLAKLEGFAYDHRWELKQAGFVESSSQSRVKSVEGDYYPTLAFKGDYALQDLDKEIASTTPKEQWQAGVVMQWNLFGGYQTDATLQEAKINALKSSSQIQQVRLLVKRQVVDAYLSVQRSKDTIVLSESISKASFQKYNQAQKRYENELADYIELQEAQQGYITSLANLVTAYYDYFAALAKLDYAVGR